MFEWGFPYSAGQEQTSNEEECLERKIIEVVLQARMGNGVKIPFSMECSDEVERSSDPLWVGLV